MKKILTMMAALGTLGTLFTALSSAAAADARGNTVAAEDKVAMCIGYHAAPDYKVSSSEVYCVPYLNGQGAEYVESMLHTYQKDGRKHPTMRVIAGSLTDQDIANPAAYYAAQTSATQNNPQK